MNLKLTDKEVSAIVASIDFMAKYIKSTSDKPDELTGKKIELIKQFTNVMNKIDKAV
jgi:hypothetical protein